MATRVTLQRTLETILPNVYFEPPADFKMKFPCIRYKLNGIPTTKADNINYFADGAYTVILIDKNPDSTYVKQILNLPYSRFQNHYTADGLHHWAFEIVAQGVYN